MDASSTPKPFLPGSVGTITDPRLPITVNQARPYIVAILLHHGALKLEDALATISPHCNVSDLRISAYVEGVDEPDPDFTHLERVTLNALRSMEECGIVTYEADEKTWHLKAEDSSKTLALILNWVSSMGAQLPMSTKF